MDIIEQLIKALEEAKAELSKSMNCAPGMDPNMGKADEVKPDKGYGSITIKDNTPKPADPSKPYGKVIQKEEMAKDSANPALAPKDVKVKQLQAQIDAGTYKPDPKKIADKMLKQEMLSCGENGQWDIKKWNMEKRCWEGYEPTPDKKAYEDKSCKPVSKQELNKSKNDYELEHHSSYNHDNGTIHQYSIHHGGQHVATGYIHQPANGHKAEPPVISPEEPKYSHHDNPKAMAALKTKIGEDPR